MQKFGHGDLKLSMREFKRFSYHKWDASLHSPACIALMAIHPFSYYKKRNESQFRP